MLGMRSHFLQSLVWLPRGSTSVKDGSQQPWLSPRVKMEKKEGEDGDAEVANVDPQSFSFVDLMKAKQGLKEQAQGAIDGVGGVRGILTRMEKIGKDLSSEHRGKLDLDHSKLLQELKDKVAMIENKKHDIDTVRKNGFNICEEELKNAIAKLDEQQELCEQHLEAHFFSLRTGRLRRTRRTTTGTTRRRSPTS